MGQSRNGEFTFKGQGSGLRDKTVLEVGGSEVVQHCKRTNATELFI